jgi:hypothetical protein
MGEKVCQIVDGGWWQLYVFHRQYPTELPLDNHPQPTFLVFAGRFTVKEEVRLELGLRLRSGTVYWVTVVNPERRAGNLASCYNRGRKPKHAPPTTTIGKLPPEEVWSLRETKRQWKNACTLDSRTKLGLSLIGLVVTSTA